MQVQICRFFDGRCETALEAGGIDGRASREQGTRALIENLVRHLTA